MSSNYMALRLHVFYVIWSCIYLVVLMFNVIAETPLSAEIINLITSLRIM